MKRIDSAVWFAIIPICWALFCFSRPCLAGDAPAYVVVDTGQSACYDSFGRAIPCPAPGSRLSGQDAQYRGPAPSYTDNGDGTVTDNNTGLMWQKTPSPKMTYAQARAGEGSFCLAGYSDWRLPGIKELYSLILFSGWTGRTEGSSKPYIDTDYFDFSYGNPAAGERFIDAQFLSSTTYVSTTMDGSPTVFGVNFADGRIKGYPYTPRRNGWEKTFYVLYVRGNQDYGINNFVDNRDGTVTDKATGLMWIQSDSGELGRGAMSWEDALAWSEKLSYAGHGDWRLPNAKELQSIVDYTRSPASTSSPAIDPLFSCTAIRDGKGERDYPYYWTSTTHVEGNLGRKAVYVAFGEAEGWMRFPPGFRYELVDVHGAGAQRSDFKIGNPAAFPHGHGPQGDVVRIQNFVRCVRDAED